MGGHGGPALPSGWLSVLRTCEYKKGLRPMLIISTATCNFMSIKHHSQPKPIEGFQHEEQPVARYDRAAASGRFSTYACSRSWCESHLQAQFLDYESVHCSQLHLGQGAVRSIHRNLQRSQARIDTITRRSRRPQTADPKTILLATAAHHLSETAAFSSGSLWLGDPTDIARTEVAVYVELEAEPGGGSEWV